MFHCAVVTAVVLMIRFDFAPEMTLMCLGPLPELTIEVSFLAASFYNIIEVSGFENLHHVEGVWTSPLLSHGAEHVFSRSTRCVIAPCFDAFHDVPGNPPFLSPGNRPIPRLIALHLL